MYIYIYIYTVIILCIRGAYLHCIVTDLITLIQDNSYIQHSIGYYFLFAR
jgi:hypothetical protein